MCCNHKYILTLWLSPFSLYTTNINNLYHCTLCIHYANFFGAHKKKIKKNVVVVLKKSTQILIHFILIRIIRFYSLFDIQAFIKYDWKIVSRHNLNSIHIHKEHNTPKKGRKKKRIITTPSSTSYKQQQPKLYKWEIFINFFLLHCKFLLMLLLLLCCLLRVFLVTMNYS